MYQDFALDNKAFKLGIAKIAFNYAVYCGIETWQLENVFDYSAKKVVDEPVVIPFAPMTLFDMIMEINPVEKIFHVVRIFNCENFLYAYIELFNTFQYYVLLSEKYNYVEIGNVDKSYGNLIEMKEPVDEKLKESLTPQNYKDVHIILSQYGIDIKELLESLKEYHAYGELKRDEQDRLLREHIGKRAYEQIRKESYIKEYTKLLKRHYDSIDFINMISSLKDTERISRFLEDFQFYSSYKRDCINIEKYKKFLPDGSNYPEILSKSLNNKQYIKAYNYMKFYMLEERFK